MFVAVYILSLEHVTALDATQLLFDFFIIKKKKSRLDIRLIRHYT